MKALKQFNETLNWSTRIFVLMAISLIIGAFVLNAWGSNFALAVALSLAIVLLTETIILSIQHHPRTWRIIGWFLLLILFLLLLVGAVF